VLAQGATKRRKERKPSSQTEIEVVGSQGDRLEFPTMDAARFPNLHVSPHPLVAHKLALLRDRTTEPKKFRELVRELSWLLGYEAMADLTTQPITVETPLEATAGIELEPKVGLVPVLRAGLGMVDAMLELMPSAEVWRVCTVSQMREGFAGLDVPRSRRYVSCSAIF